MVSPRRRGKQSRTMLYDNGAVEDVKLEHDGGLDYRALIREQRRELEELKRAARKASPRLNERQEERDGTVWVHGRAKQPRFHELHDVTDVYAKDGSREGPLDVSVSYASSPDEDIRTARRNTAGKLTDVDQNDPDEEPPGVNDDRPRASRDRAVECLTSSRVALDSSHRAGERSRKTFWARDKARCLQKGTDDGASLLEPDDPGATEQFSTSRTNEIDYGVTGLIRSVKGLDIDGPIRGDSRARDDRPWDGTRSAESRVGDEGDGFSGGHRFGESDARVDPRDDLDLPGRLAPRGTDVVDEWPRQSGSAAGSRSWEISSAANRKDRVGCSPARGKGRRHFEYKESLGTYPPTPPRHRDVEAASIEGLDKGRCSDELDSDERTGEVSRGRSTACDVGSRWAVDEVGVETSGLTRVSTYAMHRKALDADEEALQGAGRDGVSARVEGKRHGHGDANLDKQKVLPQEAPGRPRQSSLLFSDVRKGLAKDEPRFASTSTAIPSRGDVRVSWEQGIGETLRAANRSGLRESGSSIGEHDRSRSPTRVKPLAIFEDNLISSDCVEGARSEFRSADRETLSCSGGSGAIGVPVGARRPTEAFSPPKRESSRTIASSTGALANCESGDDEIDFGRSDRLGLPSSGRESDARVYRPLSSDAGIDGEPEHLAGGLFGSATYHAGRTPALTPATDGPRFGNDVVGSKLPSPRPGERLQRDIRSIVDAVIPTNGSGPREEAGATGSWLASSLLEGNVGRATTSSGNDLGIGAKTGSDVERRDPEAFPGESWADKLVCKREEQSVLVRQLERELASTVSALRDERRQRRSQAEMLRAKLDEARSSLRERDVEDDRKEAMARTLMSELEALRSRCDQLITSREQRAEEAEKTAKRLQEDNRELAVRVREAEARAVEARAAREGADVERDRITRELGSAIATATTAELRAESAESASNAAAALAQSHQDALSESQSECERLRKELDEVRRRESDGNDETEALRVKVKELSEGLASSNQRCVALEERVGSLENGLSEAEGKEAEAHARLRWTLEGLGESGGVGDRCSQFDPRVAVRALSGPINPTKPVAEATCEAGLEAHSVGDPLRNLPNPRKRELDDGLGRGRAELEKGDAHHSPAYDQTSKEIAAVDGRSDQGVVVMHSKAAGQAGGNAAANEPTSGAARVRRKGPRDGDAETVDCRCSRLPWSEATACSDEDSRAKAVDDDGGGGGGGGVEVGRGSVVQSPRRAGTVKRRQTDRADDETREAREAPGEREGIGIQRGRQGKQDASLPLPSVNSANVPDEEHGKVRAVAAASDDCNRGADGHGQAPLSHPMSQQRGDVGDGLLCSMSEEDGSDDRGDKDRHDDERGDGDDLNSQRPRGDHDEAFVHAGERSEGNRMGLITDDAVVSRAAPEPGDDYSRWRKRLNAAARGALSKIEDGIGGHRSAHTRYRHVDSSRDDFQADGDGRYNQEDGHTNGQDSGDYGNYGDDIGGARLNGRAHRGDGERLARGDGPGGIRYVGFRKRYNSGPRHANGDLVDVREVKGERGWGNGEMKGFEARAPLRDGRDRRRGMRTEVSQRRSESSPPRALYIGADAPCDDHRLSLRDTITRSRIDSGEDESHDEIALCDENDVSGSMATPLGPRDGHMATGERDFNDSTVSEVVLDSDASPSVDQTAATLAAAAAAASVLGVSKTRKALERRGRIGSPGAQASNVLSRLLRMSFDEGREARQGQGWVSDTGARVGREVPGGRVRGAMDGGLMEGRRAVRRLSVRVPTVPAARPANSLEKRVVGAVRASRTVTRTVTRTVPRTVPRTDLLGSGGSTLSTKKRRAAVEGGGIGRSTSASAARERQRPAPRLVSSSKGDGSTPSRGRRTTAERSKVKRAASAPPRRALHSSGVELEPGGVARSSHRRAKGTTVLVESRSSANNRSSTPMTTTRAARARHSRSSGCPDGRKGNLSSVGLEAAAPVGRARSADRRWTGSLMRQRREDSASSRRTGSGAGVRAGGSRRESAASGEAVGYACSASTSGGVGDSAGLGESARVRRGRMLRMREPPGDVTDTSVCTSGSRSWKP